jgi:hypothetical protein
VLIAVVGVNSQSRPGQLGINEVVFPNAQRLKPQKEEGKDTLSWSVNKTKTVKIGSRTLWENK